MSKAISFVFHHRSAKSEVVKETKEPKKKNAAKRIMSDEDFSEPESVHNQSDEDYQ